MEKLVSALKKNRDFVLKHRNFEKLSEFGHMDNFEQINNRVRNIQELLSDSNTVSTKFEYAEQILNKLFEYQIFLEMPESV